MTGLGLGSKKKEGAVMDSLGKSGLKMKRSDQ